MRVSVIVPIYKGEKYIGGLLDMVQANCQTLASELPEAQVELLLVNDYPAQPLTDPSWEGECFFSVRVIENPRNMGIHGARVNGLKYAEGDYLLMLDQDDRISNNCIASLLKNIGDAAVCVGNGYKMLGKRDKVIYRNEKKHRLATHSKYFLRAACQIVSPGHCLIRKSAIPETWLTHIVTENGADDLFLWLLLFNAGAKFAIDRELVYVHVDTGKNVSADIGGMLRSDRNVIGLMKQCGLFSRKQIRIYERRIDFLEVLAIGGILKKLWACFRNLDICLCKLYAYYR